MSDLTLEQRVSQLEKLMQELTRSMDSGKPEKDWRCSVGMFDGDPIMESIIKEGQRIREEDRRNND